jgi:hypothetical protein|tara:strand:- start:20140 stop:20541 length:402 start_codon:yes stop_codon:yes gene_type:complete
MISKLFKSNAQPNQKDASPRAVNLHPCSPTTNSNNDINEHSLHTPKATRPIPIVRDASQEKDDNSLIVGRPSSPEVDHMQAYLDETGSSVRLSSRPCLYSNTQTSKPNLHVDDDVDDDVNGELSFTSVFGSFK